MKETTYGDLLACYNVLLEYAGRQYRHLLDVKKRAENETITPAVMDSIDAAAEAAERKLDAARQIIADFYFEGDTADAQDTIMAMAEYLDYEDRAAEALAEWAPPFQDEKTVITW